jgi:hypothetical protein
MVVSVGRGPPVDLLNTRAYLWLYLVFFVSTACGTLALIVYFVVTDLHAYYNATVPAAASVLAIIWVFAGLSLLVGLCAFIFILNEGARPAPPPPPPRGWAHDAHAH